MYPGDYCNKCDKCRNYGSSVFAKSLYDEKNEKWIFLCSKCWVKFNQVSH